MRTESWDTFVKRVVIHTSNYLNFDGSYSAGGRQRHIRDLAGVIRDRWGRDVLIVQKGTRDFSTTCGEGLAVVGLKSNVGAYGDPQFARRVSKMVRPSDGLLYASGEDAWPFFLNGAKAVQHGVWWDGPQSWFVRAVQKHRVLSCMEAVRSMLCVDTNFINWLRCQGATGYGLAEKCIYIPNYADLANIVQTSAKKKSPVRLICARRFEEKRGALLFVDALGILKKQSFPFAAHISTVGGIGEIRERLARYSLLDEVTISEDSMDVVLQRYGAADVAVVPTLWSEGTSLACVEAICAGVPVVTTPVGGLGNLVVPGFNGFVVQPTAQAIADALTRFSDVGMLETMSKNCAAMRESLGKERWNDELLGWLRS